MEENIPTIGDETDINTNRGKKLGKILNNIQWTKKKVNKELHKITTGSGNNNKKYDSIPITEIFNVLEDYGLIVIMEDDTRWEGFLIGGDGQEYFDVAWKSSEYKVEKVEGVKFYVPLLNAKLSLSWHRYETGRYEIITYLS